MNRLFLVRHGGSTANRNPIFYNYSDSAVCLTTHGVRQALNTGGVLKTVDKRWSKPGNFALETFRSEYFRTLQTSRIVLDQMELFSNLPAVTPLLNERDYGTAYDPAMDREADCTLNGSESSIKARVRLRAFLSMITPILPRADVMAFSHMGAMRALIAEILNLSDDQMMKVNVPNGQAFQFDGTVDATGIWHFQKAKLKDHLLNADEERVSEPPAAKAAAQLHAALTRGGPGRRRKRG